MIHERDRYHNSKPNKTSLLDGLSWIETVAFFGLPILITYVDYMIIESMFSFVWWVSLIISAGSTVLLIMFITMLITWLSDGF